MNGIININKSKGITSFDVIAKLRKLLNMKRIGHAGTLDPLATGVLPVFLGNHTRLIQYIPKVKSYTAYARLGIETNTYDMEGEIVAKKIAKYDFEHIKKILTTFQGKQLQTPPIYSAISVNGKRLYEYARKNQEVEIPQKEVEIFKIEALNFDTRPEYPLLIFNIECASGVYIRSIIHDLGVKLGTGAMMENLTRTMSGNLRLENSVELKDLTPQNVINHIIKPDTIIELPKIVINESELLKIRQGQYLINKNSLQETHVQLIHNDNLIAIAQIVNNKIQPKTVL